MMAEQFSIYRDLAIHTNHKESLPHDLSTFIASVNKAILQKPYRFANG